MLNPSDFEYLQKFLKETRGLVLKADDLKFASDKLDLLACKMNYADPSELIEKLRFSLDPDLARKVVESMTHTKPTFLSSDIVENVLENKIFPLLKEKNEINAWYVPAQTGQPAYSLLFALLASDHTGKKEIKMTATDISEVALEKARLGVFSEDEIEGQIPLEWIKTYFDYDNGFFKIKETYRKNIYFKQQNLIQPFSTLGNFDLILCRYLTYYFDDATKKKILDRLNQVMNPGGVIAFEAEEPVRPVDYTMPWNDLGGNVFQKGTK